LIVLTLDTFAALRARYCKSETFAVLLEASSALAMASGQVPFAVAVRIHLDLALESTWVSLPNSIDDCITDSLISHAIFAIVAFTVLTKLECVETFAI
jgi:hypothetical protein